MAKRLFFLGSETTAVQSRSTGTTVSPASGTLTLTGIAAKLATVVHTVAATLSFSAFAPKLKLATAIGAAALSATAATPTLKNHCPSCQCNRFAHSSIAAAQYCRAPWQHNDLTLGSKSSTKDDRQTITGQSFIWRVQS
jgi:hypothetical protein